MEPVFGQTNMTFNYFTNKRLQICWYIVYSNHIDLFNLMYPWTSNVTCSFRLVKKCNDDEFIRNKVWSVIKIYASSHHTFYLDRFSVCEMYCLPLLQGHDSPSQDVPALSGSRFIYKQAKHKPILMLSLLFECFLPRFRTHYKSYATTLYA